MAEAGLIFKFIFTSENESYLKDPNEFLHICFQIENFHFIIHLGVWGGLVLCMGGYSAQNDQERASDSRVQ